MFLCSQAVRLEVWLEIEVDVRAIDYDAEDAANDDAGEDCAHGAKVKPVDSDVDQGKRLEV